MNNVEFGTGGRLSLAQRLAQGGQGGQGRIPTGEALRCATLLAESLRKAHDEGRVHGFLTPQAVWLNGLAVELAVPAGQRAVTPYTAPELLAGRPADRRSDIFSFGAILYEMLTGRRAFAGETQGELAHSLKTGQPAPAGNPAADKLLAGCLAKEPDNRWQQIQKVILELKMLAVAGRRPATPPSLGGPAGGPIAGPAALVFPDERAMPNLIDEPPLFRPPGAGSFAPSFEAPAAPPEPEPASPVPRPLPAQPQFLAPALSSLFPAPAPPSPEISAIRNEIQQSESRLATRLQLGEKAMAVLNRAVADALTALRGQIATLTSQVASLQDRANLGANLGLPGSGDATVSAAALARIEQTLKAFGTRMEVIEKGIGVLQDRVARTEQEAEAAKHAMTEDFTAFEERLRKQERAVDSARTAMAQTDDLVKRLVEALEALQATVLQRSEEWTASVT